MITYAAQPSPPVASDGEALSRVLRDAGVGRDDMIWVTGPAGLTALIWLNREGYNDAAYAHANRIRMARPADAVLIPHAAKPAGLVDMLEGATCVREGGVLIVQLAGGVSAAAPNGVMGLLSQLGYQVQGQVTAKGRTVCIARRFGHGGLSLAA